LLKKEQEAKDIVSTQFGKEPLGCIAISQMLPNDPNRPIPPIIKKHLD